jgi:hypothetical protein
LLLYKVLGIINFHFFSSHFHHMEVNFAKA